MADGGLWRLFEERFAGHARGILDFYHAAQQLWKGRPPGWMGGPPGPAGGLSGHGTACGTACPMGSWQT